MTTLVLGASGATGKQLVEQLLLKGQQVKIIVRPTGMIPESWNLNEQISILKANVNEMSVKDMAAYIQDCSAVASCLGHNLSLKGIYGKPRRLVTDAVRLLCDAIEMNAPANPVKLVLMNTTGNRNLEQGEQVSFAEKIVVGLVRILVPPHSDNEQAADYLSRNIGLSNPLIEWSAVRPDSLIEEGEVSEYEVHASPTRSAIFHAGKTSRINVGHFMATLITDPDGWNTWKGRMPVIYNKSH